MSSTIFEYCEIDGLELSNDGIKAVNVINSKINIGNVLAKLLVAYPFVQIFSGKARTDTRIEKITKYDWEEFGNALLAVPSIVRTRVYVEAEKASWTAVGKERDFWQCIKKASR